MLVSPLLQSEPCIWVQWCKAGDPLLFRGTLTQVPDLARILTGCYWCVRESLMCKSQPILAGTAHGGAAANYRIVQQGLSEKKSIVVSKATSELWRFLLSIPLNKEVYLREAQALGSCSTRAATKAVSCCGHTEQDHGSPGGHSHSREQSSSPRSTAHLEQPSSLFLFNICLFLFNSFNVIAITQLRRENHLQIMCRCLGDVVLSGTCHWKTACDIFSPHITTVDRLAERKSNVAETKSRVGENGN